MGTQSLKHLALVLTVVIVGGLAATAASPLSGTWEMGIAFNPSAPTFAGLVQTDSDTYSKLTVNYVTDGWTFGSFSMFDISGLTRQQFTASGSLGIIILNSQLSFFPVLGSSSAMINRSSTTNSPTHKYDLGQVYFVGWVSATGVKVNASTTHWYVQVSLDGTSWDTVSAQFTGNGDSGQITVGRLVRYVQILATDGSSAYVDESHITISVSANAWTTTARFATAGVTLSSSFTKATGGSNCSLTITGPQDKAVAVSATVYFNLADPDYSFCFDRVQGTFGFDFGCVKDITATWKINQSGFDSISFSVPDIDVGIPYITFDGKLNFSLLSKTLSITPSLNLGSDTCFTIYASLEPGPGGATEITGLSIYGLGVSYDWDGVSFKSLSYLDGLHHVKDTYWEQFTIKSTSDSCCGGNFAFETSTYFQDTHTTLFDWAETDLDLSVGLGSGVTISTSIVVDTTGFSEWKIGWSISW
jgi:hypothetical protein